MAFKEKAEPEPEELLQVYKYSPELKSAFYKLTPGRQRGYIIYFSQPKQSQTRFSRIEKSRQKIMEGQGMND